MKSYELYPRNDLINGNIANLLYSMDKYDESIDYFERALLSEPDMAHPEVGPPLLRNYANLLYFKRKYTKSIKLCKQMINRSDWINYDEKHVIYWLMTRNYESMFEFELALESALNASQLKPKNKLYLCKIKKLRYMV